LSEKEFPKIFYPLLLRVLGIAGIVILCLYFFKQETVLFFLSESFSEASHLLPWQLLGDFFHAGGWCCGMVLMAKRETKKFLFLEIFFQVFFVCCTWGLLFKLGAYSPVITYAIENLLYFIAALLFVRKISWKPL
ncbi:MAG: hypothetical protein UIH18_05215, partial [Fibrobacteraceae bacterium]|nr:hypothetical protein [Fibrobacteraceae bacterium]